MLRFENLSKRYDNSTLALDNINLRIRSGEFVFLVGSSGAGKSTILKLITREEDVTTGAIFFDNKNISKIRRRKIPFHRREIGVIFQDFKLLENKTVYENVAYALEIVGASGSTIRRDVPKVLSLVKLSDKKDRYPDELSGGEQQRVSIARSVVNNPKLILADEPTGNLDLETSEEIMEVLEDINKRGTTIIMATHAMHIVDKYKKRVVRVEGGKIVEDTLGRYAIEED